MRRLIAAAALLLAAPWGAAPASAQSEGTLRVRVEPDVAGAASRLVIVASGQQAASGGELPRSASVAFARGARFDPRAIAARCTEQQASAFACPEASRMGRGDAQGTVSGALVPGGSQEFDAAIDVYLAPRRQGEIAGIIVQVREPRYGFRASARGSLVRLSSRHFGAELRFDFPESEPLPPGFTLTVQRIEVTVGARRTVDGERRTLLRNPPTCPGSWPYRIRVRFSERTVVRNGSVRCRASRARPQPSAGRQPSFTG